MRKIKKLSALMLAVVMVLAMALPGMTTKAAEDTNSKTITIKSSATVSVDGTRFLAYKILDAVDAGTVTDEAGNTTQQVSYTVPEAMKAFYNARYNLTSDMPDYALKVVAGINSEDDMYAFAKAAAEAAAKAGFQAAEGIGANGECVISGLPAGYYAIVDQNGDPKSQVILDTAINNLEITLKADKPTIDKKIDGANDTDPETPGIDDAATDNNETLVDKNNAAVGDVVPYVITSIVPSMAGYEKYGFVITDTLSKGLTLNDDEENGFVITIQKDNDVTTLTRGTDYTITKENTNDGGQRIVIRFTNFIKWKEKAGYNVIVKYNATLNENAVLGSEGNSNEVKLNYSNNPSEETDADPKGETATKKVYTYVTGLELSKINGAGDLLAGAEFTLEGDRVNKVKIEGQEYVESPNGTYYKLKDGTYTTTEPGENGDKYASTSIKYELRDVDGYTDTVDHVTATAVTGADGKLIFKGLAAGTYTITEIKAPDGYNMLEHPITVTIGCDFPEDQEEAVWSGSYTIGDAMTNLTFNGDTGVIEGFNVVNKTGSLLPSTGGIGTTIFYIVGAILVIGAGVILVVKKRMSNE